MERVALITGGTSGIGFATARELLATGARVVVVGRDPAKGERAMRELGERAWFEPADVASAQDVARVVDAVLARWGRLDWAVNAAADGDLRRAPVAELQIPAVPSARPCPKK